MSHARLYITTSFEASPLYKDFQKQSADVEHFFFPSFGIGEARLLHERAHIRPSERKTRDFIIHFSSVTTEAQNALLKLFEEPPLTSVFHVLAEREDVFIPTLRSRLLTVFEEHEAIDRRVMRSFLQMTPGERLAEIQTRTKEKDTAWIESIVAGTEEYAHVQKDTKRQHMLDTVVFVRQHLGNRGASAKMLLEEIALSLPVT